MLSILRTVVPASEPVTLEEAKTHCRVSGADEDAYLTLLIARARELLEEEYGRAFVTQTWVWRLDAWPDAELIVPRAPLASVSSISYVDQAGASQVWSSALYQVDTTSEPGRIVPAYGQFWPTLRCQLNAVTITFVAGAAVAAVPGPIKAAVLLAVEDLFAHRGDVITGTISSSLGAIARLMAPYKIYRRSA